MPTRSPLCARRLSDFSVALLFGCALVAPIGCVRHDDADGISLAIVATSLGNTAPSLAIARDNWPGWRGAAAGGVAATDHTLPTQWSSKVGVRWSVEIPGEGNSSPVVWDDHIFLTASRPIEGRVRLEVICLDRATGRPLWTNEAGFAVGPTHSKNGFASATPATDGQRLFVSFGEAGLYCFDFDGRQLWHQPLHSQQHEWGAAASPILHDGQVIQICDQRDDSFIAAFDAATGAVRWRTPRASSGGWSTPVVVAASRAEGVRHELIVNGSGSDQGGGWVVAYDPGTGEEFWRVRGTSDVVCPTPVVAGELVISSSGRNGPVIGIRTGGSGDVTSSHVVWKYGRGGAYVPSGVAIGDRLYLLRDEGILDCYDVANGERLWQERLRGSFTASLIAGDGKIYATSEQGRCYVIAASDRFELLATNRLDEHCLATPAAAGGELYLRTEKRLYCIAQPPQAELAASDGDLEADDSSVSSTNAASAGTSRTFARRPAIHGSRMPVNRGRQKD